MDKNNYWGFIIYNIVCIICFTILAVLFNRWWVALFVLLCLNYPKLVTKHCRVCDICGKKSTGADTPEQALSNAINDGWLHIVDGNKDFCPICRKRIQG